jgi:uncharacterized protein (TIGR03437 family)
MASPDQVDFLCPALEPATPFQVTVETSSGATEPLSMVMQNASPWIVLPDAVDQSPAGWAQPGGEIQIWGTGFSLPTQGRLSVMLGGVDVAVESVQPVPDHAGLYIIQLRVPMLLGDVLPLQIHVLGPDGKWFTSNSISIAVESAEQ